MRLLVTGTDTEIGKTAVTACLAAAAVAAGHSPRAIKPVATGVTRGGRADDAVQIAYAARHEPCVFATFELPVSPHRAAWHEDRALDTAGLLAWIEDQPGDPLFIEGIGGWRVPWSAERDGRVLLSHASLAHAVGAAVVVVAPDRLGVLNHTLLTVQAVRNDGLEVAAVVLNGGAPRDRDDKSPATNAADLRLLLDVPVVCIGHIELSSRSALARAGHEAWRGMTAPRAATNP